MWSEEGCKKVSKRGHLKAGPQGEWALVGVQGKHATSFEGVALGPREWINFSFVSVFKKQKLRFYLFI